MKQSILFNLISSLKIVSIGLIAWSINMQWDELKIHFKIHIPVDWSYMLYAVIGLILFFVFKYIEGLLKSDFLIKRSFNHGKRI